MASSTKRIARRAGFTLVEMLIGLTIGSFGMAVAAYVAKVAVRQGGRGAQANALGSSSQTLGRQLRTDIELAGYGSSGAIGIDPSEGELLPASILTTGGWNAIPAARLLDNAASMSIGSETTMNNSDLLQLIVPNPATAVPLAVPLRKGTAATELTPAAPGNFNGLTPPPACGNALYFVADYGSSTGAGRSQLIADPTSATLQFDVAQGAYVMCARLSLYWVDQTFALRRSDYTLGSGPGVLGGVLIPSTTGMNDIMVPGALDLQVALRLSSEAVGHGSTADASWAFTAGGGSEGVLTALPVNWFEVRQIRFSIPLRAARAVDEPGQSMLSAIDDFENRPAGSLAADVQALNPDGVGRGYAMVHVASSQTMYNVRYFDQNLPAGTPAEPY
ncbi:MAG: prepilin-type N-terminal cleavage/methylation domain-containing protein [Myxococcota bacterium]